VTILDLDGNQDIGHAELGKKFIMGVYKRFTNPRYIKSFNHFLQKVVEPGVYKKYNRKVKLKLYGIGITPKSSIYEAIPKEELLNSQATVSFFIDTQPSYRGLDYVENLIYNDGKVFLQLDDGDIFGYDPEKFRVRIHLNNRPLYPLSYIDEEPIEENKLEFKKNNIKTKLLKESVILESRYNKKYATNFLFRRVTKEELDNKFNENYEYYSDNWNRLIRSNIRTFNEFKKVILTMTMDLIHVKLIDGFLETDDEIGELYDNVLEIIDDIYGNRIARLWTQKTGQRV
jgi:hypothetical protein